MTEEKQRSESYSACMIAVRFFARFIRFCTLPITEWAFRLSQNLNEGSWCSIPWFGYRLPLELHRSVTHRLLYVEGARFVSESHLLRTLVRDNDVVVDVGANIGYLALIFRGCIGDGGRMICIEPDTDNLRELQRCMELNSISNVSIHNAAIGASVGTVRLAPGLNGHVGEHGTREVSQITLDSLIPEGPTFIKIDVEGYESSVLAGGVELIRGLKPRLFLELHPGLVPKRSEIRSILEDLNSVYKSVTLYEYRTGHGVIERWRLRYGLTAPVVPINNPEQLLAAIESGSREQPFWPVAR
jgi:FkbM family methyltransferase